MISRIHVNQHNIRHNLLCPIKDLLPVITVKDYKQNRKGQTAIIRDADNNEVARVVYQPEKPLSCGARCWVETDLYVEVK